MPVIDPPANPTNGQYYNGYIWNAANSSWDSAYAPRAATIPISSPNYIINGAFDIWQRGTSFTTSGGYTADRWTVTGGESGSVISRSSFAAGGQPSGLDMPYYLSFAKNGTTANQMFIENRVEDVRTLAGMTVTLSYYMKASATLTNSPLIRQYFGPSGSADVYTEVASHTISTTWNRYSVTFTVPSISGKTINAGSFIGFWPIRYAGTANVTIDITGVQVEVGAAATDFRRNAPSIQAELAACQRYYFRKSRTSIDGTSNQSIGNGWCTQSNYVVFRVDFPVEMRISPSSVDYGNASYIGAFDEVTNVVSGSSISLYRMAKWGGLVNLQHSGATTQYRPYGVFINTDGGYIGFNAEL